MRLYLNPTCYSQGGKPELKSVEFPQFGRRLVAGVDVKLVWPHRNKQFFVACAAAERKMKAGILVDVPDGLESVVVKSTWSFAGYGVVFEVHHHFVDHELSAASDDALLWHEDPEAGFARRWPPFLEGKFPMQIWQRLEPAYSMAPYQRRSVWLPSIEPERLTRHHLAGDRMPDPALVFAMA